MADPRSPRLFKCSSCGALYQVVKAEGGPETVDHKITCRVCGGPFAAREGSDPVLMYGQPRVRDQDWPTQPESVIEEQA